MAASRRCTSASRPSSASPAKGAKPPVGEVAAVERLGNLLGVQAGEPAVQPGALRAGKLPLSSRERRAVGDFGRAGRCNRLELRMLVHHAFTSRPSGSTSIGPPKDVTAGAVPTNFSICTRQVLALVACARLEVPMSSVSVLGSP